MRIVVAIALVLSTAMPAVAAPEDLANDIAGEVMSPYCEGVTLHDCPSAAAADLRVQIEEWAESGWSRAQIMSELEDRFGPRIHALPQESEGAAAWILPGIAVVAGIALVAVLARRWARRSVDDSSDMPGDAGYRAEVERELAALRRETP